MPSLSLGAAALISSRSPSSASIWQSSDQIEMRDRRLRFGEATRDGLAHAVMGNLGEGAGLEQLLDHLVRHAGRERRASARGGACAAGAAGVAAPPASADFTSCSTIRPCGPEPLTRRCRCRRPWRCAARAAKRRRAPPCPLARCACRLRRAAEGRRCGAAAQARRWASISRRRRRRLRLSLAVVGGLGRRQPEPCSARRRPLPRRPRDGFGVLALGRDHADRAGSPAHRPCPPAPRSWQARPRRPPRPPSSPCRSRSRRSRRRT